MNPDHTRMARLEAEIGLKRAALAEERAALVKLQKEIESFASQYDRVIGPLEAQLDAIRQEIEARQAPPPRTEPESIWGPGFSSFEESFDAKYRRPQESNPTISAPRRAVDESELRTLYRKLARKYHPDTTTDPDEKTRFTIIMAQINAAYRARNMDELRAIDGQRVRSMTPPVVDASAQSGPSYFDLIKVAEKLDEEIRWIRSEHSRLLSSPLMSLKIEASIARSQGRDLLREVATRIRADLDAARAELAQLRRDQR